MMLRSHSFGLAVFGATVGLMACQVAAQRRLEIPTEKISSAGQIVTIGQGVFHVKNVGGDQWLIRVEAPAKDIVVKGPAEANWLRAGMPVEFRGLFRTNKDGRPLGPAREPIAKLKVLSPRGEMQRAAGSPAVAGAIGVNKEPPRGSFLVGTTPKPKAPKTEKPPENTAAYTVSGVLKSHKDGRITVLTGRDTYTAELAADVEISVDVSDVRLARVGDEFEFEGWHYPGQENLVHATKVWINAARPFGATSQRGSSPDAPTAKERRAINDIQIAVARAGKLYEEMKIDQAADVVRKIQADMEGLAESGNASVIRLLKPKYARIKQLHAFLEMEGCALPPLKEP